jgi:hypothetical protein
MRAVIRAAIGKALLLLDEPMADLAATTTVLSTTSIVDGRVVWGRGRHFRAAKDLPDMP